MNTLVLLTNFFPFGSEEPYLEEESKYYLEYFDRVYICSLQLRKKHTENSKRELDERIRVIRVPKLSLMRYLFSLLPTLLDKRLYRETLRMLKGGLYSHKRFVRLVFSITRSHCDTNVILKSLKKDLPAIRNSNLVIYSYRLDYQPYVACLLQRKTGKGRLLSRAHGFDLYEERRPEKYIPLRPYIFSKLDVVLPVSEDGKEYLKSRYPDYREKFEVSRLGSKDHGVGLPPYAREPLRLISVSTLTSVKRVDLIVKALSLHTQTRIEWDHFGDGQLSDEIRTLSATILPPNVNYTFHGHLQNKKLMEVYSSRAYHFFVNVSSSEGVPVSIMEAMSFGIPCIATDVGGTSEIVKDNENGYLLRPDFLPSDLAHILESFKDVPNETYVRMRRKARSDWERVYNSEKNYRHFMRKLLSLGDGTLDK